LVKFLSNDLVSASADIETKREAAFNQNELIKIHFDFKSKVYSLDHYIQYEKAWSELTKDGASNPPPIQTKLPGSTINPWTKHNDKGIYEESLKKQVPNWLAFERFSQMLSTIAISNYSPAPNGMFRADELKYLKKMYKRKETRSVAVWRQLAFDNKGNIIGISSGYLKAKLKEEAQYEHISVFNSKQNELRLSFVESAIPALVSAVLIENGDNRLIVLNTELNFLLHKFAAVVFPDPEEVKMNYFKVFNKKVKKGLQRFENTLVANE
jgi:hypothetical protein